MPAFAPSRQRSPTEITSVPPPDSVPMIEAPPPTSESRPTTTPAEIRPSTIERAQGARVVVDEALVHHGGAGGEVGAQPHPVGVGDPHAGREHVVDHPRELVHPVHGHRAVPGAQPGPDGLEALHRARAHRGPHDVGQAAEDPVQVDRPWRDQPVAEQVQPQVRVGRVGRRERRGRSPPGGPRSARSAARRGAVRRPGRRARPPRSPGPGPGRGSRCRAPRPSRARWPGPSPRPRGSRSRWRVGQHGRISHDGEPTGRRSRRFSGRPVGCRA